MWRFRSRAKTPAVVIWTTTPWTIPGNRAIAFSRRIAYGRYRVTEAPADNWAKAGSTYILAKSLAAGVFGAAQVEAYELRRRRRRRDALPAMACAHPLARIGYGFDVPLLDGDHVTEDAGTGFVHTAPGHGREDFDLWTASTRLASASAGIDTRIPYTVDENGAFTDEAPGFTGKRVLTDKGEKGDANEAVIKALIDAGALIARGKLKHQYPHSWRSKKPVIFRNTPQWFIAMDRPFANDSGGQTLRELARRRDRRDPLGAADRRKPHQGHGRQQARLGAVAPARLGRAARRSSCARADTKSCSTRRSTRASPTPSKARAPTPGSPRARSERFLGDKHDPDDYDKIDDLLEVWFDSGSTHAFVLEDAVHFPGLAGIRRAVDGGSDEVMYLEGSDQHRGWFQSSLLESCGTRGRAPFDIVLTHGFTLDEKGRKMSKSLGNQTFPQDVISASGADILRLWVASVDYSDDQRIGPEILKAVSDNYRKLRNTIRWMLGTLAHHERGDAVGFAGMADLDRLMLHKLAELDAKVREAYANFDYARVIAALSAFMNADLSAFYFDIRKDALYCDPPSSAKRLRRARGDRAHLPRALRSGSRRFSSSPPKRRGSSRDPAHRSVHLEQFPDDPGRMARRRAGAKVGDDPRPAPRRDRRDRDRARQQGDRLVARGRAARLSQPAGAHRGARRGRFRRSVHHLRYRHRDGAAGARRRFPPAGTAGRRRRRRAREGRQMRALLALFRSVDRLARFSRRHPARRRGACANSGRSAACREAARARGPRRARCSCGRPGREGSRCFRAGRRPRSKRRRSRRFSISSLRWNRGHLLQPLHPGLGDRAGRSCSA